MATRITSAPSRRLTHVLNAFERWGFDERGWYPETRRKYVQTIRRADRWFHENVGHSVLWASLRDLKKFMFTQPQSPSTRNNVRNALAAFGEYCVDAAYWDSNHASRSARSARRPGSPGCTPTCFGTPAPPGSPSAGSTSG